MDDVLNELTACLERAAGDDAIDGLRAARRARELLALLEGRFVDLARAEGVPRASSAVRRPWLGPPDAA